MVTIIQLQLLLFSRWEIVLKQIDQVEVSSLTVGQKFQAFQNLAAIQATEVQMADLFISGSGQLLFYLKDIILLHLGFYMIIKDLDIMETMITFILIILRQNQMGLLEL